jgi:hypothetical protein
MYNPGSTIKFTEATGSVDQELLRNEYLAAENRILRAQIKGRLLLSDAEKATLADRPPAQTEGLGIPSAEVHAPHTDQKSALYRTSAA